MFKTFHEETDGIEYISEITIKQEERNKIAFGATKATMLELLYNIAEWLYEYGKQELFMMPELPQLPLEKLLPEIQYAF